MIIPLPEGICESVNCFHNSSGNSQGRPARQALGCAKQVLVSEPPTNNVILIDNAVRRENPYVARPDITFPWLGNLAPGKNRTAKKRAIVADHFSLAIANSDWCGRRTAIHRLGPKSTAILIVDAKHNSGDRSLRPHQRSQFRVSGFNRFGQGPVQRKAPFQYPCSQCACKSCGSSMGGHVADNEVHPGAMPQGEDIVSGDALSGADNDFGVDRQPVEVPLGVKSYAESCTASTKYSLWRYCSMVVSTHKRYGGLAWRIRLTTSR